ncbi:MULTISPECIES: hypothetical protein [Cupriavidus]|uniref:hypothetical protein n=1 Tax=Cupriavidus TaxID=106589 RepID=UPI00165685B2|nr:MULTISPECIES: hypothetical protein [Cupriavidus]
MKVNQGLLRGRFRRMNRRQKKKADAKAVEQERAIVDVGGYARCDFVAESTCDCDLCQNASPGARLYAAISSAGEGGEETDHYACPSCALARTERIRTDNAWWKTAVECPVCSNLSKHLAFDLMPPQCEHCAPYGLVSPAKATALRGMLAAKTGAAEPHVASNTNHSGSIHGNEAGSEVR